MNHRLAGAVVLAISLLTSCSTATETGKPVAASPISEGATSASPAPRSCSDLDGRSFDCGDPAATVMDVGSVKYDRSTSGGWTRRVPAECPQFENGAATDVRRIELPNQVAHLLKESGVSLTEEEGWSCPIISTEKVGSTFPELEADAQVAHIGNSSHIIEGPPERYLEFVPKKVSAMRVRTRRLSCTCYVDHLDCRLYTEDQYFDGDSSESFAIAAGTDVDEAFQAVRLFRSGQVDFGESGRPSDLDGGMHLGAVARCGEFIELEFGTWDQNWGGALKVRMVERNGKPILEMVDWGSGGV